ncbi:MAG: hypothetical protein NVSMB60_25910 [Mycobacterium sp.]
MSHAQTTTSWSSWRKAIKTCSAVAAGITFDAEQTWTPDNADRQFSMSAYGAVFAEVAVDEALGTVRVRRVYACYDGGRIINPKLAHSQAIGGMVGGIGMALLEGTALDYRDGRVVNANMSDYRFPSTPISPHSTRHSWRPRNHRRSARSEGPG